MLELSFNWEKDMILRSKARRITSIGTILLLISSLASLVQAVTISEVPIPVELLPGRAMAVDSSNNLWFGANVWGVDGRIVEYDTTHGTFTVYNLLTPNPGPVLGVAIDSDDNVWVTEENANKIAKLNVTTGDVSEYSLTSGSAPISIAIDESGNIWIGCRTNKILKYNPSTETEVPYSLPAPCQDGITQDLKISNGKVWFTEPVNYYLGKFDPVTEDFSFYGPVTSVTKYLDFDSKGNVWFSEPPINTLGLLNITDETITEYELPSVLQPGQEGAYGMAVDINDDVWVAERHPEKIAMFDPETKVFTEYDTNGTKPVVLKSDLIDTIWYITEGSSWHLGRLDATRYVKKWEAGLEATVSCRSEITIGEEYTLKVMIKNVASSPVTDTTATLTVRPGMTLRSGESETVSIGPVEVGEWQIITWHITATKNGNYLDKLEATAVRSDGETVRVRVFWMSKVTD